MFNTTFTRPLVTLVVVIGLLAAAGPASAARIEAAATPRTTVTMLDYEGSALVLVEHIAVAPHTTQLALENTLVSNIAAADPQVCMSGS